MDSEVETAIKRLEAMADALLKAKRAVRPRRPIVIEFCGTPKAGKTSCINSLVIFLKRNGFRVKVLTERASICPINDKFDPNFNVWTACSILTEFTKIISNESKDYDVVILDRGMFDAICWFHWQLQRHHLDRMHYDIFRDFFLAERWTSKIDIVYTLMASEKTALDREYAHLLTRHLGSVMNPSVIASYNRAINDCVDLYSNLFNDVRSIDSTDLEQNEVSYRVTTDILNALDELISEKIGYFRRSDLAPNNIDSFSLSDGLIEKVELRYAHRAEAEANGEFIQPIPVAVIASEDRSRVLIGRKSKRATSSKSAEKGKSLFYFGGHVRVEDKGREDSNLAVLSRALQRELKEELGLDYVPDFSEAICIIEGGTSGAAKHMAIAVLCVVDFDSVTFRGDAKEFTERSLVVVDQSSIKDGRFATERWSQVILQRLLNWTFI